MSDTPEILPLGPDGVLVRFSTALSEPANRAALAFRAAMEARALAGVVESATSLTSAFFRFSPSDLPRAVLEGTIREELGTRDWHAADLPQGRKLWELPAAFGGAEGPGLAESADLAGVSEARAIEEICSQSLRVLALGFAPGQPYLGFLPEHWNIPRQSDVTPEVPRGAVVVAVRQVIPFANAAPTGWRQVGRTGFRCFDPSLTPEIPLSPGDELCFRPVPAADLARLETAPHGGATWEALE
ncbi:MAG: allophanate hydrolase subunit 1 [Silicimonas sp.]|nr:allophanate hydrolase subunit 1 [Silicimonas sp.]